MKYERGMMTHLDMTYTGNGNEMMKGGIADNSGRNEIRAAHQNRCARPKNDVGNMRIQGKQSLSESDLYYYASDLTDGHIDFDQCEFCVLWATGNSFLPVFSAVPLFINFCPFRTARNLHVC